MNRKGTFLTLLGGLVAIMLLSACGPSQAELDATATNVAADKFATQTAEAPTATPTYTITPIPTNTPTATPDPNLVTSGPAGCNQEILERFLHTKAPEVLIENIGIDSNSAASIKEELSLDVELFSDAITFLILATYASYGGSEEEIEQILEDHVWKIEQTNKDEIDGIYQTVLDTDEPCQVYLESVVDGEIGTMHSFFIQIEKEIIIPGDPSDFTYWNYMLMDEEEALKGFPLSPFPTNTSRATPFPSHTPTATDTPQPDPNMVLEAKGTYLQEFISSEGCASPGMRMGEITLDTNGNIWVAGGCQGLDGLHVFDGTEWTSHDGSYLDLAHDLEGQIWAISPFSSAVDVYDGQQWRTIEGTELGIGEQQILQVEVDNNGRIWIITDEFGVEQVAEIVLQDGQPTAVFSHPEFTFTEAYINSLDTDNRGNLWASVWGYGFADERWSSLNILDGSTWQQLPDQDADIRNVVRTRYDNLGNVWFVTACSGVITYDGATWTTVVEGATGDDCSFFDEILGFTLDPHGRVWAWSWDRIRLLDDGAWIDFLLEDSGLPDIIIFGLAVDELGQVWIGTADGVVMATIQ